MAKKKKVSKKVVIDRYAMIETIAGIYTDEADSYDLEECYREKQERILERLNTRVLLKTYKEVLKKYGIPLKV